MVFVPSPGSGLLVPRGFRSLFSGPFRRAGEGGREGPPTINQQPIEIKIYWIQEKSAVVLLRGELGHAGEDDFGRDRSGTGRTLVWSPTGGFGGVFRGPPSGRAGPGDGP